MSQNKNVTLIYALMILPRLLLLGKPLTTEIIMQRAKQIKSIHFGNDRKHLLKGDRREPIFIEQLPYASSVPGNLH